MLSSIVDKLVFSIFGLNPETHLGQSLHFFIYDSLKIFLLLFVMITTIGVLRSFVSPGRIKRWLSVHRLVAHFFASAFGALTPFCSCSSIPIFLGFLKTGVPLGVSFSFLITSPLINEYLAVLMLGFFGWKITVLYIISGILIGVIAGIIMQGMRLEKFIVKDMVVSEEDANKEVVFNKFKDRLRFGLREAQAIIKRIWLWIFVGVGLGALIHNYVPREIIQAAISKTGPFSVPLAVLLGVPMYGSCAAIVPVAMVLFKKGIPLGTALAFMMATSALSLPEAVLLRRAMKLKLILIFFGITTLGIIFTGYCFNFLQTILF